MTTYSVSPFEYFILHNHKLSNIQTVTKQQKLHLIHLISLILAVLEMCQPIIHVNKLTEFIIHVSDS